MTTTIDLFEQSEDFESVAAGTTIFSMGETGHKMYVVIDGEVDITIDNTHFETVGKGGIFGEMALIDEPHIRSANAIAKTDARIVPVDEKQFFFMVQQTPGFSLNVMRIMAERILRQNRMVSGKTV